MVLGKRTDGAHRNYDGLMGEVKIWDPGTRLLS